MKTPAMISIFFFFFFSNIYAQSGWQIQNTPTSIGLWGMYFVNINTGYVVANDYNAGNYSFLKTTNGGANWIEQLSALNTYKCPIAVFFNNENTGHVVGGDVWSTYKPGCYFRTTNGGVNWIESSVRDTVLLRDVFFANLNTGFTVGSSMSIYKTTNNGVNWFSLSLETQSKKQLRSIYFFDANTGMITGDSGIILRTTNGGNTWNTRASNVFANLNCIEFINMQTGFATGSTPEQLNVVIKTTDGGNSWFTIFQQQYTSYNFFFKMSFPTAQIGYITCNGFGEVLKTFNGGVNWTKLEMPPVNQAMRSVFFIDSLTGYISRGTTILKTTNGGESLLPNPPSNLTGNPMYYGRIILSWVDNSVQENGFTIQRKLISDTSWTVVTSVQPDIRSYLDSNLMQGTSYQYRVFAFNSHGNSDFSNIVTIVTLPINDIIDHIPDKFNLYQNYPNPFNPSTNIKFDLPKQEYVSIKIYDINGREVDIILNESLQAGQYNIPYEIRQPSGIYFYKIIAGEFSSVKKMVVIK